MNLKIIRKDIKNPNIKIKPTGEVILTVPTETSDAYIEKLLKKRNSVIEKQLNFFKENYVVETEKEYITGENIRYLGKNYRLRVVEAKEENVIFFRGYIHLYTSKLDNREHKKFLIEKWKKIKLEKIIGNFIEKYSKKIGKDVNKIKFRKMKTRWGSCNTKKGILNFNTNLIEKTKYCIEYVVFHELAHLKYSNHNKNFYNYLLVHMPDYKVRKNKLELKN